LSGTTTCREGCSTVVVVDVESSGGVCVVGSNLRQTELVVCLCGVACVNHKQLCVVIARCLTIHPVVATKSRVGIPEELVSAGRSIVIVVGVVCNRVKLTSIGDDEGLASGVGIVVIGHVCSGIRKSVLSTSVDRISECQVTDNTSRSARCHGNHCRRRCSLGECRGCRLSDCAHNG
jgi:hypothetical protein